MRTALLVIACLLAAVAICLLTLAYTDVNGVACLVGMLFGCASAGMFIYIDISNNTWYNNNPCNRIDKK